VYSVRTRARQSTAGLAAGLAVTTVALLGTGAWRALILPAYLVAVWAVIGLLLAKRTWSPRLHVALRRLPHGVPLRPPPGKPRTLLCSAVAGSVLELGTTANLSVFTLVVITGTNLAIILLGQETSRGAVERDSGGTLVRLVERHRKQLAGSSRLYFLPGAPPSG
jgi:hypothetical protein